MSETESNTHGYVKKYLPCMIKFTGRRAKEKMKNKNLEESWLLKACEQNLACTVVFSFICIFIYLYFHCYNTCFAITSWGKNIQNGNMYT